MLWLSKMDKSKRSYEFWGSSDWILKESSIKSSCARAMRETIFAVFCWVFSALSAGVSPSWSPSIISINQDLTRSLKFSNKTQSISAEFRQCHNNKQRLRACAVLQYCSHSHSSGVDHGESGSRPLGWGIPPYPESYIS